MSSPNAHQTVLANLQGFIGRSGGVLLVLVISFFLTSCAAMAPDKRPSPVAAPCEEVLAKATTKVPIALSAEVRVQTHGGEALFLEGTLLLLAPDKIRVDVFSPLGALSLLAVAQADTLSIAVPTEQTFYRGRATRSRMAKAFLVPLTPQEIVGVLRADPLALSAGWRQEGCFVSGQGNEILFSQGEEKRQLLIDSQQRLVRLSDFTDYAQTGRTTSMDVTFHYAGSVLQGLSIRHEGGEINMEIVSPQEAQHLSEALFKLIPAPGMQVLEMF